MIESAGAAMLTVHGRLREQKGIMTGLADWSKIMAVKNALNIPVIANGNILSLMDADRCIQECKVDGVMSADPNLCNPAIFDSSFYASWYLAGEYLDIIKLYPGSATIGQVRGHFFKMFHASLSVHVDLREDLSKAHDWELLNQFYTSMKKRLIVRVCIHLNPDFDCRMNLEIRLYMKDLLTLTRMGF